MNELMPGIISLVILVLMFFNLITFVVLAFYARHKIDRFLSRCSVIVNYSKTFGGLGVMSDYVKLGLAGSIFIFTKAYHRKGLVDIEQVKNFPGRLRFLILAQGFILSFLVVALMALNFWLYLFDVPRLSDS